MGFWFTVPRAMLLGVFAMAGSLLISGCHSATTADLVGEYVAVLNNQTVNVAKVTPVGSGYGMEWYADGKWLAVTGPVTLLSKQQLGEILTGPVDGIVGLQSKELRIIMVPKGWTQVFPGHNGTPNTEFKSATGYVWFSPLGLMDLKKL